MPYPESCPECGSTFRNTGTHFTARRNEVGRHVLLELGCQNTTRRFWWDFTTGSPTQDGRPSSARRAARADALGAVSVSNGSIHATSNGHVSVSTLDLTDAVESSPTPDQVVNQLVAALEPEVELMSPVAPASADEAAIAEVETGPDPEPEALPPAVAAGSLREAFLRQLQLDRLTLRQMRSWVMSEEARRAIEVAAGATEATYERLALILFGSELPQLLGKPFVSAQTAGMSAEERLELQREKARVRARLRRAAAKAARG